MRFLRAQAVPRGFRALAALSPEQAALVPGAKAGARFAVRDPEGSGGKPAVLLGPGAFVEKPQFAGAVDLMFSQLAAFEGEADEGRIGPLEFFRVAEVGNPFNPPPTMPGGVVWAAPQAARSTRWARRAFLCSLLFSIIVFFFHFFFFFLLLLVGTLQLQALSRSSGASPCAPSFCLYLHLSVPGGAAGLPLGRGPQRARRFGLHGALWQRRRGSVR